MKRDIKNEIISGNLYDFQDWFEKVDPDFQEVMDALFDKDDPRQKIITRVIRKQKIKKIGGENEL